MIVISPHGYIDVTELNKHVIDNYISMDKINITIGAGAVKQIITNSGFTQEVPFFLSSNNFRCILITFNFRKF